MPDKQGRWRWATGSQIGTSHLKHGTRKQDAYVTKALPGHGHLFAISDGAGSAPLGGAGAWLTCRFLASRFREWFTRESDLPSRDELLDWLDELRDTFSTLASARDLTRRAFAATLVALVRTPSEALAIQIGDSALVGRTVGGVWQGICWPENGEFASSTFFITDDPEIRLRTAVLTESYDAFALFSDGLEDIALEQEHALPFPGFLDPMLKPVDSATSTGKLSSLSTALDIYLSSERVCERTDDDKTLILISGKE